MAQTVSPPPADAPRPLPRRGVSPKGVRAPRLVPQDIFWTLALAALALTVSLLTPNSGGHGMAGAACAAGTTALLFLLGWRARDRQTGIVAGLLLATSLPFAQHAVAAPREALAVLLAVASLLAFVGGSSLLALAFAGLGALTRPDILLLGLLLLLVSLAQRRRAVWGGAFFLGIVCVGGAMLYGLGHLKLPALHLGARDGLLLWAVGPGMVFSTWLLLPFCAELGEAPRRARWLPVVLWTLTYFLVSCFIRSSVKASEFALLPLWCVLAAGGLSRLLPSITDLPIPWARYTLATLAVLSPLAVRLRAEWPQPLPTVVRAVPPMPPPAHPITATVTAVHPTVAPIPPPHPRPVATIKPQPKPVAKKPTVAAPKPHPVARPHAVYHSRRFYRPRRTYQRFFRHF